MELQSETDSRQFKASQSLLLKEGLGEKERLPILGSTLAASVEHFLSLKALFNSNKVLQQKR